MSGDLLKQIQELRASTETGLRQGVNKSLLKHSLGAGLLGLLIGGGLALNRPVQSIRSQTVLGDDKDESADHRNRNTSIDLNKYSHVKQAGDEKSAPADFVSSVGDLATDTASALYNYLSDSVKRTWSANTNVSSAATSPWALPLAAGAMGAGTYGGYKLTSNYLSDKRKRDQLEAIEQKRQQLDDLIALEMGQHKTASENRSGGAINKAIGLYGALALALGTGGYLLGSNYLGGRERTSNQLKALRQSMARRQQAGQQLGPILTSDDEKEEEPEELQAPEHVVDDDQPRALNAPTPNFLDEDDVDEPIKVSTLLLDGVI